MEEDRPDEPCSDHGEKVVQFKKRNIGISRGNIRSKKRDLPGNDGEESDGDKAIARVPLNGAYSLQSKGNVQSSVSAAQIRTIGAVYSSSRDSSSRQPAAADATAISEVDTAHDRDSQAVKERTMTSEVLSLKKKTGTFGPMRAPAYLRRTSRFDYQPDICKDYKETGFCGYGDNCKFLHDRGDYKSGWQMEKEWDEQQQRKRQKQQALPSTAAAVAADAADEGDSGGEENYEINESDDEFPFACFLCRESFAFKPPVVTLCGHYFCQECALQRGSTRCAVCDKQTFGVFNKARKLIKYMQSKNVVTADDRDSAPLAAAPSSAESAVHSGEDHGTANAANLNRGSSSRKGQWEEVS